ncbi:HNH endonuclease [Paenibacillus sp. GYB004]|uniref:HNH endonuclease n=1 Tax=Paenibacillus sp. GYB004 TaxID=2994393 RepID=UPI002F96D9F5
MKEEVSKSAEIRQLYDMRVSVAEIARRMGIKYQFVYNVVSKYKKRRATNSEINTGAEIVNPARKEKSMGNRMFSRMNYQVVRGMRELITTHELSPTDWSSIKEIFEHHCAYCGIADTGDTRNGLVPDHLIPASLNGDYLIGNVVPACHDCNDRRGKKPWESWLRQNYPADAETRVITIVRYLQQYPYTPPERPEERLTEEERQEYESILSEWGHLWQRARALRDQIARKK